MFRRFPFLAELVCGGVVGEADGGEAGLQVVGGYVEGVAEVFEGGVFVSQFCVDYAV